MGPVYGPNGGGIYGNDPYGPYSNYPGRVYDPSMGNIRVMTPQEERLQRAMEHQRNLERRKQMLSDTDKLVQLTNSLQSDLEDGTASPDAAKMASQVEKLAKNVQKKMTGEN